MADTRFSLFAVHTRRHQATVIFQATRVVVRLTSQKMQVAFRNPKPQKGRQRWQACRKHALLLVSLAAREVERRRLEQEERELKEAKDLTYA